MSCQLANDIKPNLIILDGAGGQFSAVPQLGESWITSLPQVPAGRLQGEPLPENQTNASFLLTPLQLPEPKVEQLLLLGGRWRKMLCGEKKGQRMTWWMGRGWCWGGCSHICAAAMCARQPSAVILDRSQVEQRYCLALCLPQSALVSRLKMSSSFPRTSPGACTSARTTRVFSRAFQSTPSVTWARAEE